MSCPRQRELLVGPSQEIFEPELADHAASCDECSEALALLASAKTTLIEPPLPELSAEARARMWRALQAEPEASPGWFRFDLRFAALASVAAAACAILFLITRPVPTETHTLREGQLFELRAERTALISGTGLEASARKGTEAYFGPIALQQSILLRSGELALDVAPLEAGRTLVILTPAARIEIIGTRLRVLVDPRGTTVTVEEGRVRVQPTAPAVAELELVAGEQRRFELTQPEPSFDPARLARDADRLRRTGHLVEAAKAYASLAEDPRAAGYAEEALLRRARILGELGRDEEAMSELGRARVLFPGGVLEPERAALKSELLAAKGRLVEAAAILSAIDSSASEAIAAKKRELAEKIRAAVAVNDDPKIAEELGRALVALER